MNHDQLVEIGARAILAGAGSNGKATSEQIEPLCEDEGCDHYGTPHVCISKPAPQADLVERFLRLVQDVVDAEVDDIASNSNGGAPSNRKQLALDAAKVDAWAVIRETIAALSAVPVEGWRDFGTMPKDGTEFLVCMLRQGSIRLIVRWDRLWDRWLCKGEVISLFHGDLWHPLPDAPKRVARR